MRKHGSVCGGSLPEIGLIGEGLAFGVESPQAATLQISDLLDSRLAILYGNFSPAAYNPVDFLSPKNFRIFC